MSIRRSARSFEIERRIRLRDAKQRQRKLMRRLGMESLEDRRMMAVGPQLEGILPDSGSLLIANQTLNTAPSELTFNFDSNDIIDQNTVTGIQVWRSGNGTFTPASARTDLGTNGAVQLTIVADALETTQKGIKVSFAASDFGGAGAPTVTVSGTNISVLLNTNSGHQSTAQDVVTALNANVAAGQLITASITAGTSTTNVASNLPVGSSVTLAGADAASATTNIINASSNTSARFQFTAVKTGAGNSGTQITLSRANLGTNASPVVTVTAATATTPAIINVQLNSTPGSLSKASDLINAINNSPAASAIVKASLIGGTATTDVTTPLTTNQTLTLAGETEVPVIPGYEGIGTSTNQVIVRFASTLPSDTYHIDIFGNGSLALKNSMGNAFNSGINFQQNFTLSLGPQIESVVPQPVDLNGNTITQRRNQIDVYFNNDTLNAASATNPAFYQLIYTNSTLTNTDDTTFLPTSVNYVAALNKATLTFAANIDQLSTGPGTYRLQIGTSQSAPSAPLIINPIATATSDFNTNGLANLQFNAIAPAKAGVGISLNVTKANLGPGVAPTINVFGQSIDITLNNTAGSDTTAQQLVTALNSNPNSSALIVASVTGNTAADIAAPNITYSPVNLTFSKGMGTSFSTAYNTTQDLMSPANPTGALNQSVVYTGAIVPVNTTVTYPGALSEPGNRVLNIPDANNQFAYSPGQNAVPATGDTTPGITTIYYNFRSDYGFDPSSGKSFLNLITDNEKQRTSRSV